MADEKKNELKGYHIIPHCLKEYHKKTKRRLIYKGKETVLDAFIDLLDDYNFKKETSYNDYEKKWNWRFSDVKQFINHLGFEITTNKGIKKKETLTIITPIKSKKYPDELLGLAKQIIKEKVYKKNYEK